MYSQQVMDHFQNTRNAGELENATATVELSNPVCGDVLRLAVRVKGDAVAAVRFKASGCVPTIAAGSALTELMAGRRLDELAEITAEQVSEALGGLQPASRHAAQLARDTLRALLAKVERGSGKRPG